MKISRSIRERWYSKAILIPFAATLTVCFLPALASALTCDCNICANTSGWWRDGGVFNGSGMPIQAAVDNATAGETICVWNGSYSENVNVNKRLTLRGEGADVVNVTAASADDYVFEVTVDYVNISGFNVSGATGPSKTGIYLSGRQHCNISDNIMSGNYHGIYLSSSSNNTLTSNTANLNTHDGIYLDSSSDNNTLTSNTVNSNDYYGIHLSSSSNNTLMSNTVNLNTISGIHLSSSSNNTLTNNIASNNWYGIRLSSSSNNNTLTNNIASNNDHGIHLFSSSNNNTLTNNTANSNNISGICLFSSNNYNTLMNNTANSNTKYGIYLFSLNNYNTLTSNTANSNNDYGIFLDSSSNNNTLTSNTANSNNDYGIFLDSSSNNTIYNNYFNNTYNAYDDGNNTWNTTPTTGTNIIGGPWLGGNYWSDYAGNDTNGDFLGDFLTPYNSSEKISSGGDYHPLVADIIPPIITNVTNTTLASDSVTISWATDENSDSLVKYGTSAGTYDLSKSIATMVTSHTVTLTGLSPDTLYYFVVNSTDRSGNSNESSEHNFRTAAENGSMKVTLGHGGSNGPYVTSTPTVLATEVETAVPVTTEDDDASGVEVDNGTNESTHVQTEKKGLFVFAIVFAVAGVLALVYVVIRRRNDQD